MSKDLYDLARPARDAGLADVRGSIPADVSQYEIDAQELAINLSALLLAWGAQQIRPATGARSGTVNRPPAFDRVMANGIAITLINIANSIREFDRGGTSLTLREQLLRNLGLLTLAAHHRINLLETRDVDCVTPLAVDENGNLNRGETELDALLRNGGTRGAP